MRTAIAACLFALSCAGAQAEAFHLTDVQGKEHQLSAYRGKWVLVNVWATWCAPCIKEMPELEALSRARLDVVVLGLAADGEDPQKVARFARALKVSYPIIAGDAAALRQFPVRAYPTTLLFDPTGAQVMLREGRITRADIDGALTPDSRKLAIAK